MKLLRPFLALVLLAIASSISFAQRDPSLISSRHYIGAEIGLNDSWLSGGTNFFWAYTYPYSDDPTNPVIAPLAFNSLGSGLGFHVALTGDFALSDLLAIQAKFFYRQNHTSSTEQQTASCSDVSGGSAGTATFESNYSMTLSYLGGDLGLRIQFVPESFYGTVGLEYSSLSSNKFSGGESIVSSTNGCQFLTLPSGGLTGQTSLSIPEQSTSGYFNSSQLHLKIGVGTFIRLGGSNVVLTPEIAIGIPLSNVLASNQVDAYKAGYPSNNSFNPSYASATPPSLWYASASIGVKIPFGALSREEQAQYEPQDGATQQTSTPSETQSAVPHETKKTTLSGRVTDAESGDPVKANVTVVDLGKNKVVKKTKTDPDGKYSVDVDGPGKYSVTADADKYLFGSAYYEVDDQGRILDGDHDIKLQSSTHGHVRLLVFFDFGKDDLRGESVPELDRAVGIMKANPKMRVEIAGYTDNVGSDAVNRDLSLRRANAVRKYLIDHGIEPGRIIAKGYGAENPIAPNDTDEGRASNRRVEFVVKKAS
ncbi:MAG: OmpA family protein [Bacteroidetes bacterium]|nr:OmpA family protein [Bacteroidota bacterium]